MPLYFIAIVAPEKIDEQVIQWKKHMLDNFGCKAALRSPAHITLIPPFVMKEETEEALGASLKEFSDKQKPFKIKLLDFSNFRPRVIFVQVIKSKMLTQLKYEMEEFMEQSRLFAFRKETREFHPHITLANRDLQKKDFSTAWQYFEKKSYTGSFIAQGISILKSLPEGWRVIQTANFVR